MSEKMPGKNGKPERRRTFENLDSDLAAKGFNAEAALERVTPHTDQTVAIVEKEPSSSSEVLSKRKNDLMDRLQNGSFTPEQRTNLRPRIAEAPSAKVLKQIAKSMDVLEAPTEVVDATFVEKLDKASDAMNAAYRARRRETLAKAKGEERIAAEAIVQKKVTAAGQWDNQPHDFEPVLTDRAPANPSAKGISFGSPQKEAPIPVKESMGIHTVKENGMTRLATREEMSEFYRKPEHGPIKPGAMTDQNREDHYEATGEIAGSKKESGPRISNQAEFDDLLGRLKKMHASRSLDDARDDFASDHGKPFRASSAKYRGRRVDKVSDSEQITAHESSHRGKVSNIEEIIKDPRREVMFGEFLAAQGKDDLIRAYHESKNGGPWTVADDMVLRQMLIAFDKRSAGVDLVRNALTKGDVERMTRDNMTLTFFRNSTNDERIFDIVRDALDHSMMVMPQDEFEGVVSTVRANADMRRDYRYLMLADRARAAMHLEGVDPEDLDWETIQKNPSLMKMIHKPLLLDRILGIDSKEDSKAFIDEIAYNRKVAGMLLAATVSKDSVLRTNLVEEVFTGQKVPTTEEQGNGSYDATKAENEKVAQMDALKPDAWTKKFGDAVLREAIVPGWSTKNEKERAETFREHLHQAGSEIKIKRGWLARITRAIFSAGVDATVRALEQKGSFK